MYKEVRSEMVKFPYVAGPEMPIDEAVNYMKECNIRHLPIMVQTRLVGVVSERDLAAAQGRDPDMTIEDVMTRMPFVVSEGESLRSVVNIMAENKYGCALVVDANEALIGIFTTIDALRLLEKFLDGDSKFYNSFENVITLKDAVGWM